MKQMIEFRTPIYPTKPFLTVSSPRNTWIAVKVWIL